MSGVGRRAIIIGLDGLSVAVYRALRGRGFLGAIGSLESRGVMGSIDMVPPLTPPMWTSISSGVNPGKHGIYSFNLVDPRGRVVRLHNAADVMHPRLHDMVSYNGYSSLVANLPLSSWPRIPFRGAILSDWLAPRQYGHPEPLGELYTKALGEVGGEYRDEECKLLVNDVAMLRALLEADRRLDIFSDKKLVFVMLGFIDTILHRRPREARDPRLPCLREALELTDELVRLLAERFLDESTFIVVSDHGNDAVDYVVSIPRILYDAGLVRVRYASIGETSVMGGHEDGGGGSGGVVVRLINLVMRNPVLGPVATRLGRGLVRRSSRLRRLARGVERPIVDEEASPVVVPKEWSYGIYVNEELVDNVDAIIERVFEALRRAERETGHRFIHTLARGRGGLFHGPYADRAPHIVVAPRHRYSFASANVYAPPVQRATGIGSHHPENLHIVASETGDGEVVEAARHIREPWDYAVLALAAMGLPVPHDSDSGLCRRAGLSCARRNYNTRYLVARRVALSRLRGS